MTTTTAQILLGAADDIEAFIHDRGVLMLVADRLRRFVANELTPDTREPQSRKR